MIHFFVLKGMKASVIHTELESVYAPEALASATAKKQWKRFH
jgi:hypothetical protein